MTITVRNQAGKAITFRSSEYHCQRYNTGRTTDIQSWIKANTDYSIKHIKQHLSGGFVVTVKR